MYITRETDYALRILRALASGEKMTAEQICDQEALPQQFAYKILKRLSKAEWLQSIRGADGGFKLTQNLKKVNLLDLMHTMDSTPLVGACMDHAYECSWQTKHQKPCSFHNYLAELQTVLTGQLQSKTLDEIIKL